MSPTVRRAKKPDSAARKSGGANRVLAIVGIVVILSMFLSLVIVPGSGVLQNNQETQPTLSEQEIIATILASQPTAPPPTATLPLSPTAATGTTTPQPGGVPPPPVTP